MTLQTFYYDFRELGNLRAARGKFNRSLEINRNHSLTLQLRGSMYYYSGEPLKALEDHQVIIIYHSLTLQLRGSMYYYSGEPLKALEDHQVIIIFNILYISFFLIHDLKKMSIE